LLLALNYVSESTSAKILTNLGIGQRRVQSAIESVINEGQRQESNDGGISVNAMIVAQLSPLMYHKL